MTDELVHRYAKPVPRYTSYPTAPHFHAGVRNDQYRQWLAALPNDASCGQCAADRDGCHANPG